MSENKAYIKSKKSVKVFGGKPEDYLKLHEWMDETEKWVEGKEHLIFRHHAQGIFEGEKKFGYTIKNSDGKNVPVRPILEIHINDELGFIPTFSELVECIPVSKWMGYRNNELNKILKKQKESVGV